jgi:hypothetical protein
MFSFMNNNPVFSNNKKISDYCKKSTDDSIRRMTLLSTQNSQRMTDKNNFQCVVRTNSDLPNKVNIFFYITMFLYSTSIIYKLFNKCRSK